MTASNDRPLSLAIVGCGLIGRKRAAALAKVAGTKLSYVCDLDAARSADLAKSYPGCKSATDYQKVIADRDVDAVIVATLNGALAPIARVALSAGKHVLIEKPGALGAAELRSLTAPAAAGRLVVRIGYNHRFHPGIQKARSIFESGVMGPLMFLRGRYGHGGRKGYDREWRADAALSGGGELIDQGVHLIDLASWFLGDFSKIEGHATTSFWDMKVDDNAFLSLRTSRNQTAWLHVSCTEWKNMFSLEIYGREGKISIDGLGGSYGTEKVTYYQMLPQMGPPEATAWEFPGGDDSWALETTAFVDDIRRGDGASLGLQEGIRTLEIVEAIYKMSGYPHK
jgi:predicted dehydrogenase